MRAGVAVALLFVAASTARADTRAERWLRDHGSLEWIAAAGGWRSGLGTDAQVPGFDALAGGTELLLGLDIYGPLGVVLTGRFLGGEARSEKFLEGLGGVGLQVRLSDLVRLRAGAAAGQAIDQADTATMVGGWVAGSVDLFALGGGRLALAISLRLDVDALLGVAPTLPDQSLALALGFGLRY